MAIVALIPAAGSGTRVAGERPKQYQGLSGKPMLWHAVRAIFRPPVENVFVVLAARDDAFARQDWSAFQGKLSPLYCGGETRRDSVYNGLVAMMGELDAEDWVLVHDAARPCLPGKDLEQLISKTNTINNLKVFVRLNLKDYPTGLKIDKKDIDFAKIYPNQFILELSYGFAA